MIDPNAVSTIRVGELSPEPFSLTDNVPHEVGAELKRGSIEDLATFISAFIGSTDGVGFRAISVTDGQTLPTTTQQEFILVGKGTYYNVVGGSTIICTEELNAIVSNGSYWFIGVEIPVNVELAGITQFIRDGFINTTPSEDTVFDALALKANVADSENIANKQNDLIPDGTGTKYTTVDAVNTIDLQKVLDVNGEAFFNNLEGSQYVAFFKDEASKSVEISSDSANYGSSFGLNDYGISITNQKSTDYEGLESASISIRDGIFTVSQNNPLGVNTRVKFDTPTVGTLLNFPAKTVAGTYTLATTDEVNAIDLQKVVDAEPIAFKGDSSLTLLLDDGLGGYSSEIRSTNGANTSALNVNTENINMTSSNSATNTSGGISIFQGNVSIDKTELLNGYSTHIDIETPVTSSTLTFPAPTIPGTYTLATTDETVNLTGNQIITGKKDFEQISVGTPTGDIIGHPSDSFNADLSIKGSGVRIENTTGESLIVNTTAYDGSSHFYDANVLAIQNKSTYLGVLSQVPSAIRFLSNTDGEMGAIGYQNGAVGTPFANSMFLAASMPYYPSNPLVAPTRLALIQEGDYLGTLTKMERLEFNSDWSTKLKTPEGSTRIMIPVSGRVLVNTTTDNNTDALQVNGSINSSSNSILNGVKIGRVGANSGQIVIGDAVTGYDANSTVLGNTTTTNTAIRGRVIIGTTTNDFTNQFQLTGNAKITGNAIFTNNMGVRGLLTDGTTEKFLLRINTSNATEIHNGGGGIELKNDFNSVLAVLKNNGNLLIGTTTDVSSSKLTISSTTQGVLLPRMTTSQINAITSPVKGLTVFNTDLDTLCFYTTSWQKVTSTTM